MPTMCKKVHDQVLLIKKVLLVTSTRQTSLLESAEIGIEVD